MSSEIKVGTAVKGLHIKLLDKTLMKAFSDNGKKPLRLVMRESDVDGDSHFSLNLTVMGIEDELPPSDDVVELDGLSAFDLNFDYDLSTFLGRIVLVITSSATRLLNALFVPFVQIECVIEPLNEHEQWKIVITGIEEREEELDMGDFEEIKY